MSLANVLELQVQEVPALLKTKGPRPASALAALRMTPHLIQTH
jgi:hypothetical protein